MKKTTSIFLISLSLIFYWLISYIRYNIDDKLFYFLQCIFIWTLCITILNIIAFILNDYKYKLYIIVTGIYSVLSLVIAYNMGDRGSTIPSFDMGILTIFFIGLYSLISIIYFIIQFFKNRKNRVN